MTVGEGGSENLCNVSNGWPLNTVTTLSLFIRKVKFEIPISNYFPYLRYSAILTWATQYNSVLIIFLHLNCSRLQNYKMSKWVLREKGEASKPWKLSAEKNKSQLVFKKVSQKYCHRNFGKILYIPPNKNFDWRPKEAQKVVPRWHH